MQVELGLPVTEVVADADQVRVTTPAEVVVADAALVALVFDPPPVGSPTPACGWPRAVPHCGFRRRWRRPIRGWWGSEM